MQPLEAVLNHPAVWRGGSCARVAIPRASTGFPELDAVLPGGGWPAAALTEIYASCPGLGEMQIVMPAAARLTQAGRWATLIAPPYIPYAPALAAHGLKLSRLLVVRAEKTEERFWACEQALRYPDCGAVLAWIDQASERALKRLQLAAEGGNAIALLFRSARVIPASPAALRLQIERTPDRTLVRVLKRRGSDLPAPVSVDLRDQPSIQTAEPTPASLPRQREMAS
jgi:cell division inhibitor SulA/protein ImuA